MKATVKCSVTGKEYTGKVLSHIRETPKASKYWDTAFGEWKEGVLRDEYNIYVNTNTWNYYIIPKIVNITL